MNLSYFISKRIRGASGEGFSSTIHKIAVASIAVGLAASIVAFLIMRGFQETVRNKIYSFSGHLMITKFTMNNSTEEDAFNFHIPAYDHQEDLPYVTHIQEYAHKAGLIKKDDEVLGVVFKGVGKSFDTTAFRQNMVEGKFISFPDSTPSNDVVVSRSIATKLNIVKDSDIIVHFFQNPPRFRKLHVTGIYETNLSEYFDNQVILGDIRVIRRLNDWSDSLAGGLEVFVSDPERVDEAGMAIGQMMDFDLNVQRVKDRYMQVFEWLQLLSRQVNILLVIILLVVCVNMISILLILVMERTQMIGMLKALGGGDPLIRSVFVFNGVSLIAKGLLLGNILGLGLCYIQYQFRIVKLNAQDYYMSFVPISWEWEIVVLLNILTLVVVTFVLLLPTMVIARINPIKAIRFD